MYARKRSRVSRRRRSRRPTSVMKMKVQPKNISIGAHKGFPKKRDFEGTRIPVGTFKHKKSLPLILSSSKKVLEKIIPLRNGGRSYTVLNPVTPIDILKRYANADEPYTSDFEIDNIGESYANAYPTYSIEMMTQIAFVNERNADGKDECKPFGKESLKNIGGPFEFKESTSVKALPESHGDELINSRHQKSAVCPCQVKLDELNDELKIRESKTVEHIPQIERTNRKRNTRIPIRMKKVNSWEKTRVEVRQLRCDCGRNLIERKCYFRSL